jgi:hypothetical protein
MRKEDKRLARELIEKRCGTHSLGLVYEFLLKVGYDPSEAESEFLRFMSGQMPEGLLGAARLWVIEEQGKDRTLPLIESPPVTRASDGRELVPAFAYWGNLETEDHVWVESASPR